jgi:signal transduction histidine kinase
VGQGTGLGLSISYQIVTQLHQGQLICNSIPHQGSEFTVEIPIYRKNSQPHLNQPYNFSLASYLDD